MGLPLLARLEAAYRAWPENDALRSLWAQACRHVRPLSEAQWARFEAVEADLLAPLLGKP